MSSKNFLFALHVVGFVCALIRRKMISHRTYTRILSLLDREDRFGFFAEPVDEFKCVAPGYYSLIKEPIDLKCIRERADKNMYDNRMDMFIRDVLLMFDNAVTYNGLCIHPVHKEAIRIKQVFLLGLQKEFQRSHDVEPFSEEALRVALSLSTMNNQQQS